MEINLNLLYGSDFLSTFRCFENINNLIIFSSIIRKNRPLIEDGLEYLNLYRSHSLQEQSMFSVSKMNFVACKNSQLLFNINYN